MPQNTEYDPVKRMVVLTYSGRVTMPEVREATAQALALQKEQKTGRVLIDPRNMIAWPSLVEMFQLVNSYSDMEVPSGTQLAVLRPLAPDRTDLSGFYETVCQNRGYNARVFETREDAEQWLQSNGAAAK
jgi:hypothetical protein